MAPLDNAPGVWKSGKGKGRRTPKGRQLDDAALDEVLALLGDRPRRRDLLIEFLHLIQDAHGCLSAPPPARARRGDAAARRPRSTRSRPSTRISTW